MLDAIHKASPLYQKGRSNETQTFKKALQSIEGRNHHHRIHGTDVPDVARSGITGKLQVRSDSGGYK